MGTGADRAVTEVGSGREERTALNKEGGHFPKVVLGPVLPRRNTSLHPLAFPDGH